MQNSTARPKKGKKRDPRVTTREFVPLPQSHAMITSATPSSQATTRNDPSTEERPIKRPKIDPHSTPLDLPTEDIPVSSTTNEPVQEKCSAQPQVRLLSFILHIHFIILLGGFSIHERLPRALQQIS